ncbi:MAG: nucleotidyltransferase family protein [Promethearchaeota archaeon]
MITKDEILALLEVELPFLRRIYQVRKIGLFGSYARNEQEEESNVDLLIDFEKPISFFRLFKLEDYLSKKLGNKVEIITFGALKELMTPTIVRDVIYAE